MDCVDRKVSIIKLLAFRDQFAHLASFSDPVSKVNFTTKQGWSLGNGRTYVQTRSDDFTPSLLRGSEVLELYHLKMADCVILTDEQYKDYIQITGWQT